MFEGMLREWHSLYTTLEATGSSIAHRTSEGGGEVSRSDTSNVRSR